MQQCKHFKCALQLMIATGDVEAEELSTRPAANTPWGDGEAAETDRVRCQYKILCTLLAWHTYKSPRSPSALGSGKKQVLVVVHQSQEMLVQLCCRIGCVCDHATATRNVFYNLPQYLQGLDG